ncbi:MAG: formylglycine-generating enzyme family protein [Campylobacteraceae bacterium]|jgi:formylglycine-generating enzyme required for sulfatase activity|nr:formylglycine-generating enzyme family protein [Campylobacteraceae bacterium]
MKNVFIFIFIVILSIMSGCSDTKDNKSTNKTHANSIGMEFVLIPSGSFVMGADKNAEIGVTHESPRHNVTINRNFYLGKFEVTQEQWTKIMGNNPSKFKNDLNPVESVTWYDAKTFISKLNIFENTTKYRLPTEAEWEYAARAISKDKYSFGNDANELAFYAWYYEGNKSSKQLLQTHPVGQKQPNKWGLYDMHGNVWEWTEDFYDPEYYTKSPLKDPINRESSLKNITIRGGSWINSAEHLRSTVRYYKAPTAKEDNLGFRVVFTIEE